MIKKTRIRFILFTLTIVFIVLAILFGLINYYIKYARNGEITQKLNSIEMSYFNSRSPLESNYIICEFSNSDNNTSVTILDKTENYSENFANSLIENAVNGNTLFGSIQNNFYKISANRLSTGGSKILIIADMTDTIQNFHSVMLKVLLTLIVIFVLISLIVIAYSKKVLEPLKQTLIKQRKFISDASHELKTPVAVISANADVIKSKEDSEWIQNIKDQTDRMNNLVTNLLTLASIDENKISDNKAKFNVSDEVFKVILPFDAVAFEKNKTIVPEIEQNIEYFGNVDAFRKIVETLIENSIKYATTNTEIKVSLIRENNRPKLSVYNKGCNIPDTDNEIIFERFYRGEQSRARDSGGSGLGLSIAKSLAILNKWDISCDCKKDDYMQITLVL